MPDVTKALSPEEKTVLSNIQSLIGQLMQTSESVEAAAPPEEPPVEKPIDGIKKETTTVEDKPPFDDDKKKEKKSVKKDEVTTTSEGVTPEDASAEEITDRDLTETTDESLAKAIITIAQKMQKSTVKKAAVNPVIEALSGLTIAIKSIADRQDDMDKGMTSLLTGLGVTEQMEIARKSTERVPVVNNDNDRLVKALEAIAGKNTVEKSMTDNLVGAPSVEVRKNLTRPDMAMYAHLLPKNITKFFEGE